MKKILKKCGVIAVALSLILSAASCAKNNSETEKNGADEENTSVLLVENGKTEYKIVVPENATETELFAAEELETYFSLCIDGNIDTVTDESVTLNGKYLSVGDTALYRESKMTLDKNELGTDGYKICTTGETVVMNAAGENGKIYAVYEFLKRNLGVEFYAYDEIKTPQAKNVYLKNFALTDVPDFLGRDVHYNSFFYNQHPNYSQHMRVNSPRTVYTDNQGEGCAWSTLWAHEQLKLLPPSVYAEEHPEWYPAATAADKNGGICWTNAELQDEFAIQLEKYIEAQPDKTFFSIAQTDGAEICQCDACAASHEKYTVSGTMMRFNNEIAKRVKSWLNETYPERKIYLMTFAYQETLPAPVKRDADGEIIFNAEGKAEPVHESVVADEMILVRFAPLYNCFSHDFLDEKCNEETKNIVTNRYAASARDSILGWSAVAENLSAWNYCVPFGAYAINFNNFSTIQRNYQIFKEYGFIDILDQGASDTSGSAFENLRIYIQSQLLWDTQRDYETLVNDFMENYYKEAAKEMREYYDYVRLYFEYLENTCDAYTVAKHQIPSFGYSKLIVDKDYFPRSVVENFKEILDRALEKARSVQDKETREKLIDRINAETIQYRYLQLELYANYYKQFEAPSYSDLIDEFEAIAAKAGLIYYAEAQPIADKIAEWRQKA